MKSEIIKIEKINDITPYLPLIDQKEVDFLYQDFKENGDTIFGILADDVVVGLAIIIDSDDFMFPYIFLKYRYQGYGYLAVLEIEKKMNKESLETIFDYYSEEMRKFAKKCGYSSNWGSSRMVYNGKKFVIPELYVRNYQDEDYLEVFYLSHEAFHAMRVSTGCFPDSKVGEPSEESRQAWLKYKDDTFIYIVNNEIIGCAELEDAELDTISIKISEQGKGYGKLFTKYMTNMLIDRGYKNPVLWCVVGNKKARALYDSLGYKETSCWAFANKTINK